MPTFLEVHATTDPYFNGAMDIYVDSFPPNERHSLEVIRQRVTNKESRLFVGVDQNEVVLMCLIYNLSSAEFLLFDYMAVSATKRGLGVGSLFLQFIRSHFKLTAKYMVLEVENPAHGDNREEREKRVAFYKKNGAKLLAGVRYILPALDNTTPTEMVLMVMPEYPGGTISGSTIKRLIATIYAEVYNRPAHDPLLQSFIETVPKTVTLI
jgi:hypothetical protein